MTSASPRSKPPDQAYAEAIQTHAQRTKHLSLFPGQNYKALANFLSRSYTLGLPRAPTEQSHDPAYALAHKYDAEGSVTTTRYGPRDQDLQQLNTLQRPLAGQAQLLFLRGFLAPNWLNKIGAQLRIDPEFFRRHLQFVEPQQHFDLPTLPSASSHILELPLTTIGARTTYVAPTSESIQPRRESTTANVQSFLRNLERKPALGQSIVRDVSLHSDSYFTIEQNISIYVQQRTDGWLALVWMDCGQGITKTELGAWMGIQEPITVTPLFQHKHKVSLTNDDQLPDLRPHLSPSPAASASRRSSFLSSDIFQSASLLHYANGRTLDPRTLAKDACYGLNEVFCFVAYSSMQYLNLITTVLADERSSTITVDFDLERMSSSFATLQHLQLSLVEHTTKLSRILSFIKSNRNVSWLRVSKECHPREHDIAETAIALLLADYEHLLQRGEQLVDQCADQSALLMNRATLDIAQRGISQSESVGRLTLLAFLFLPLGVTTSFFGMNFVELGDDAGPKLNIWVWFALSLPIFLISCIICFWQTVKRWLAWIVLYLV